MPGIAKASDLTDTQRASLGKVQQRYAAADKLHSQYTPRWETYYGLSRNWRRLQKAHAQARTPNDKDVVLNDLKREFGTELFIPYCFTVIETNLPRILSKQPRYKALPGNLDPDTHEALGPLEQLYERDAVAMNYERKLQETVRSGLRYGLGVQKSYWEKKTRDGKKVVPRALGFGRKVIDSREVVFEGPQVESVDIFEFFWDPTAHDLESANYVIHRSWRSMEYVADKVAEGRRNRAEGNDHGWFELDLEKVKSLSSPTKRGESMAGRYEASGLTNYETGGDELFEVWEYHDREQILTVLGGAAGVLVQEDLNPFLHGDLPFQIYRPTLMEHEFVGIGEIEPISHLQWELNTLRGQRRDAATLALNRGFFYLQGSLDPANIVIGSGVFNPVNTLPSEAIMPMPFEDIPQSGISEEQAIKSDIELTTGISEALAGAGSAGETATGTQLVQQAASLRIKQKARNLHNDLLVPEAKLRESIYEQYVVAAGQSRTVRVEDPRTPTGFVFVKVTPEMFSANVEVVPVDGSTEADDPAQKKHDASELAQALAPFAEQINVESLVKYILKEHDIEPTEWLKPPPPSGPDGSAIADKIGQAMAAAGIPEEEVHQILEAALSTLQAGEQQNPEEAAPPEEEQPSASANGQPPEPIGAQ